MQDSGGKKEQNTRGNSNRITWLEQAEEEMKKQGSVKKAEAQIKLFWNQSVLVINTGAHRHGYVTAEQQQQIIISHLLIKTFSDRHPDQLTVKSLFICRIYWQYSIKKKKTTANIAPFFFYMTYNRCWSAYETEQ